MDDIDELLRRSMKSLDDQVPAGYFDTLASRTLARLEDGSMETSSDKSASARDDESNTASSATSSGVPPRDEDSGLHDIRSLASTAKARAAAKRSTQNPIVVDEDILANSTGSWKNVALPEPAKMVSLPDLAELPSKREVKDAEKAHREAEKEKAKVAKAERTSAKEIAKGTEPVEKSEPAKVEAAVAAKAAPIAAKVAAVTPIDAPVKKVARPTAPAGNRNKTFLIAGVAAAAAAAAVGFVALSGNKHKAPQVAQNDEPPPVVAKAPVIAPPPPPAEPPPVVAAVPEPEPVAPAPVAAPPEDKKPPKAGSPTHEAVKVEVTAAASTAKAPAKTKGDKAAKPEAKDGEPSFDDLLKEAGVHDQEAAKPKLEKKSLTGDDFKKGMSAISSKAQGCYAGTQGTATVKLTIAPTGKIAKVTVTGPFADTPVANCVAAAVQNATFPPWDGGPQSFGYSYLLSE
jgi:outer membrane biosynthesis protein TonB